MSGETITLPLDVVMAWRHLLDDDDRVLWLKEVLALADAIKEALWKPEQGVHYKASEHRPPEDVALLLWDSAQGWFWGKSPVESWRFWMLQPPAPEVQP